MLEQQPTDRLLKTYSSWYKLKRAVAYIIKLKTLLKANCSNGRCQDQQSKERPGPLQVEDLKYAEDAISRYTQAQAFAREIKILSSCTSQGATVHRSSPIYRLSPVKQLLGDACVTLSFPSNVVSKQFCRQNRTSLKLLFVTFT